jgi:hypothetical protein
MRVATFSTLSARIWPKVARLRFIGRSGAGFQRQRIEAWVDPVRNLAVMAGLDTEAAVRWLIRLMVCAAIRRRSRSLSRCRGGIGPTRRAPAYCLKKHVRRRSEVVELRMGAVAWSRLANAPFPIPAHQTQRADFRHWAFPIDFAARHTTVGRSMWYRAGIRIRFRDNPPPRWVHFAWLVASPDGPSRFTTERRLLISQSNTANNLRLYPRCQYLTSQLFNLDELLPQKLHS